MLCGQDQISSGTIVLCLVSLGIDDFGLRRGSQERTRCGPSHSPQK